MFSLVDKMLRNSGAVMKGIIRGVLLLEIVLTLFGACAWVMLCCVRLMSGFAEALAYIALTPLGVFLAIASCWLSCLPMYGFAEIVDTAIKNRRQPEPVEELLIDEVVNPADFDSEKKADDYGRTCPVCEGDLTRSEQDNVWYCADCQKKFELLNFGLIDHLKEI